MNNKTRTILWRLAAAVLLLPAIGLAADKSMLSKVQSKMSKPAAVALLHKAMESQEKLMGKLDKIMSKDSTSKSDTEDAWTSAIADHKDTWQGLVVKATKIQRGGAKKDTGLPGTWPTGYSVWGNAQVKFLNEVRDKKKGHMMIRFRVRIHPDGFLGFEIHDAETDFRIGIARLGILGDFQGRMHAVSAFCTD